MHQRLDPSSDLLPSSQLARRWQVLRGLDGVSPEGASREGASPEGASPGRPGLLPLDRLPTGLEERLVDGGDFRAVLSDDAPEALRLRWLQMAEALDRYAAARDQACREERGFLVPGQDSCFEELRRLQLRLDQLRAARAELARLVQSLTPASLHGQSLSMALGTLARQLRGERHRVLVPSRLDAAGPSGAR